MAAWCAVFLVMWQSQTATSQSLLWDALAASLFRTVFGMNYLHHQSETMHLHPLTEAFTWLQMLVTCLLFGLWWWLRR
jgi:hypothetical protein